MSGLAVYTVPGGWEFNASPDEACFDVVAGVELPNGRELWTPITRDETILRTSKQDAERQEIPFDDVMSGRAVSFFSEQVIPWFLMSPFMMRYNCHKFAFWMRGLDTSITKDAFRSNEMAETTVRE